MSKWLCGVELPAKFKLQQGGRMDQIASRHPCQPLRFCEGLEWYVLASMSLSPVELGSDISSYSCVMTMKN